MKRFLEFDDAVFIAVFVILGACSLVLLAVLTCGLTIAIAGGAR